MHRATDFFPLFNISPYLTLLQIPQVPCFITHLQAWICWKASNTGNFWPWFLAAVKGAALQGRKKRVVPTSQDSAGYSVRYIKLPQISALVNGRYHTCLQDVAAEWIKWNMLKKLLLVLLQQDSSPQGSGLVLYSMWKLTQKIWRCPGSINWKRGVRIPSPVSAPCLCWLTKMREH